MDDLIDWTQQSVSLAVREMCCRIAADAASFQRAAANLARVGQFQLSDELLRQVVESEGRAVLAWQDQEQLALDFEAGRCTTAVTADGQPVTRVYVGIDGFMLPMVTDVEAGRRFEKLAPAAQAARALPAAPALRPARVLHRRSRRREQGCRPTTG